MSAPVDSQLMMVPQSEITSAPTAQRVGTLVRRTIFDLTADEFNRLQTLAEFYAASDFNGKGRNQMSKNDFFLVMLKGLELGIAPMAAVDMIDIISGKPTLSAKGMLALVQSSGQLDDIQIDATAERCIVTIKRFNQAEQIVSFTIEDARKFQTSEYKNGQKRIIPLADKFNWKSQPEIMLKWRAVTKAVRQVFPDVIGGLYTPEEIDTDNTIVLDDGDMQHRPQLAASNGAGQPKTESNAGGIPDEGIWYTKQNLRTLIGWARAKNMVEDREGDSFEIDAADLLSLSGASAWSDFESGKEAWATIQAEHAKLAAEASKKTDAAPAPQEEATDEPQLLNIKETDLVEWIIANFDTTLDELTAKLDDGDLTRFASADKAKTYICQQAIKHQIPIVAETVTHKSAKKPYLEFETVGPKLRIYSRTQFAKMTGDDYEANNNITELPAGETIDIDAVLLTWENKRNYNIVTAARVIELEEIPVPF